jgi:hypothetical protein
LNCRTLLKSLLNVNCKDPLDDAGATPGCVLLRTARLRRIRSRALAWMAPTSLWTHQAAPPSPGPRVSFVFRGSHGVLAFNRSACQRYVGATMNSMRRLGAAVVLRSACTPAAVTLRQRICGGGNDGCEAASAVDGAQLTEVPRHAGALAHARVQPLHRPLPHTPQHLEE